MKIFLRIKDDDFKPKLLSKQIPVFKDGIDHTNFPHFLEILDKAYENENERIKRGGFKSLSRFSQHIYDLLIMEVSARNSNINFNGALLNKLY